MSLHEIETAITQLPPSEVASLTKWLSEYQAEQWDAQIENDLESGKLDSLLAEVDNEVRAGLAQPI